MTYSKVVCILNIDDFGLLSGELSRLKVPGVTVSKSHGYGDYYNEYSSFGFSENMRVEIYTATEQATEIAERLSMLASELTDGGGVVAVEPVDKLYNVKKLE